MQSNISLVITTLEEPEETVRTVESALISSENLEVIVVDDCSHHPPRIEDPRVKVLVQPRRTGVGINRNVGANVAKGDTIIFSDCHMRFPPGLLNSLHEQSQCLDAIVFPKCRPLSGSKGVYWGAYLYYSEMIGVDNCWRSQADIKDRPTDKTHEVPSMLGACYAFPRHIWNQLGAQWWNTFGVWGYTEQHMTLRCWFQGIKIYLDPTQHVFHQFWSNPNAIGGRRTGAVRPFQILGDPKLRNAIATLRSIFNDEIWHREFHPLFKHLGDYRRIISHRDVRRNKRWFSSRKTISDEEVVERLKMRKHSKVERKSHGSG